MEKREAEALTKAINNFTTAVKELRRTIDKHPTTNVVNVTVPSEELVPKIQEEVQKVLEKYREDPEVYKQ